MHTFIQKFLFICFFSSMIYGAQNETPDLFPIKSVASGNLLDLSGRNLTTELLKTIISMPVQYENQAISLDQVPQLLIKLNDNMLHEIPVELCRYHNIIYLALRNNKITEIPSQISNLANLEGLDLTDNSIKSIDAIVELSYLKKLLLCGNSICSLPETFEDLESLELLDLSFNDLTTISPALSKLTELKIVYLHGNYFMNIDNLETKIAEIPSLCFTSFIRMSRKDLMPLLTIHFKNDESTNTLVPELNLSHQKLQSIFGIDNLMVIVDNHFVPLKMIRGLALKLSLNKLTRLPHSLGNLTLLRALHLGSNQLERVPQALGDLVDLHILDLSWNQLETVPATIGMLQNLEALFLNNNYLLSIPSSIGLLTNLKRLSLKNNPALKKLPETLCALKKLQEFSTDAAKPSCDQ